MDLPVDPQPQEFWDWLVDIAILSIYNSATCQKLSELETECKDSGYIGACIQFLHSSKDQITPDIINYQLHIKTVTVYLINNDLIDITDYPFEIQNPAKTVSELNKFLDSDQDFKDYLLDRYHNKDDPDILVNKMKADNLKIYHCCKCSEEIDLEFELENHIKRFGTIAQGIRSQMREEILEGMMDDDYTCEKCLGNVVLSKNEFKRLRGYRHDADIEHILS